MKKISAILLALVMMLSMVAMAEPVEGDITIQNAQIGQTYTIYKVLDAHYNAETKAVSYTVDAEMKAAIEATTNSPFAIATTANSEGAFAVTQTGSDDDVLTWLGNNVSIFEQVKSFEADATTETVNVGFGYYYIITNSQAAVTVTTNTPHVKVIDKNTTEPGKPSDSEVKEIVLEDGTKASTTEAQIGHEVDFEVEFVTTNYIVAEDAEDMDDVTKVTKYTIVDTPFDMEIKEDTIVVTVNGEEPTTTVTKEVKNGVMTIVIDWVDANGNHAYADPSEVKVTYTATVTATDGEAKNSVVITYNENEEVEEDENTVTTHQFTLKKVDPEGKELEGAEFELYDAENNKVNVVACDADDNVIEPTDTTTAVAYYRVAKADEVSKAVVIKVGETVIKGLDAAAYQLKEIKAPEGYNMLTANENVTVKADDTTSIEVENNAGTALPETGGMGTTIFYVVGGLMMAAAVVLLVSKKKVNA